MLLAKDTETTLMLEKLLDGYDKRLRPNFGSKVVVVLTFYLVGKILLV